jgi:short-subunit dehydrogenase
VEFLIPQEKKSCRTFIHSGAGLCLLVQNQANRSFVSDATDGSWIPAVNKTKGRELALCMSEKQLAVVTGASGGIGLSLARQLAAMGYDLLLSARSETVLENIARELSAAHGIKASVLAVDLSEAAGLNALLARLHSEKPAVLINNAGFGTAGSFADSDAISNAGMMQLNMVSLVQLCHAVLPGMRVRRSGYILNISSLAAFQPAPGLALYGASKSFVLPFSEALNHELKGSGVSVTASCPGPVDTGFHRRAGTENSRLVRMGGQSSAAVAKEALQALFKRKPVIIHGRLNRLLVFSTRFVPRSWLAVVAARFMQE